MDLKKHAREVGSALRSGRFQPTGDGRVHITTAMNVVLGGAFKHTLHRADGSVDAAIDPNMLVGEGINAIINAFFHQGTQPAAFYVSIFKGNANPADGWTAANYDANADEFTAYNGVQTVRPQWVIGAQATTTKTVGNSGSEAMFQFNAGGPYNLYGAAIHTTAPKEDNTGILVAATRFATPRLNQIAGDKLGIEYVLTGQDAG
ncbi:MAG TPA: hypothetical protein VFE72_08840 [Lysobacter sp.]|nr:hypothetical protein [Lysobacter sp.]